MSYDWNDWAYDMHLQEQYEQELVEQNIAEFTKERLHSYFVDHPNLAAPAAEALESAKRLLPSHPTAALVFAAIAQEVLLRDAILTPVVYGLVANEAAAQLITSHAVGTGSPTKFRKMLLELLADYGDVDLLDYKRTKEGKTLWTEITEVIERRNAAVHRADTFDHSIADAAIAISDELVSNVFPRTITALGLHLHGLTVCRRDHALPQGPQKKSGRGPLE
jgi:hypothetical protein